MFFLSTGSIALAPTWVAVASICICLLPAPFFWIHRRTFGKILHWWAWAAAISIFLVDPMFGPCGSLMPMALRAILGFSLVLLGLLGSIRPRSKGWVLAMLLGLLLTLNSGVGWTIMLIRYYQQEANLQRHSQPLPDQAPDPEPPIG